MKPTPLVCVVEDRDADAGLFELALQQYDGPVEIRRLRDGVEALDFLTRGEVQPSLVLLDLKMPRVDGLAVLEAVRAIPGLPGQVPVVVFSASDDPDDVKRAYAARANSYVRKPIRFEDYRERVLVSSRHDRVDAFLLTVSERAKVCVGAESREQGRPLEPVEVVETRLKTME